MLARGGLMSRGLLLLLLLRDARQHQRIRIGMRRNKDKISSNYRDTSDGDLSVRWTDLDPLGETGIPRGVSAGRRSVGVRRSRSCIGSPGRGANHRLGSAGSRRDVCYRVDGIGGGVEANGKELGCGCRSAWRRS